jgi:hypothetical protein
MRDKEFEAANRQREAYYRGEYLPGKWKAITDFIRRDRGWYCQDCYARGILTKAWTIHHERYKGVLYDEWNHLYDDALLLLCGNCHAKRHGREKSEPPEKQIVTVSRGQE